MTIEQNYFTLFQLPQRFQIDASLLAERYLEMQKTLHPDRYAHLGEREQLRAVQASAHLNEALATLKSPLKRAAYLLELKGVDTHNTSKTISDGQFLMQQMMLREQLEQTQHASDPYDALEQLLEQLEQQEQQLFKQLELDLASDDADQLQQGLQVLNKLHFFDKLRHEIELMEDQLDH